MFRNKKIQIIIISIIILGLFISSLVMLLNKNGIFAAKLSNQDKQYIKTYQEMYKDVNKDELLRMYGYYKDWTKVGKELLNKKVKISDEKVNEFYSMGVTLKDMQEAEFYATQCTLSAEDIMNKKIELKTWDNVIKDIKIDTRPVYEKLGLTKLEINKLKKFKVKDLQLTEVAVIKRNNAATIGEIVKQLEQGNKIQTIICKYKIN